MHGPLLLAHGLGGRTDLPVPLWMVLYGGAAVVAVSFAALRFLWPEARWEGTEPGRVIAINPRVRRALFAALRLMGAAFFLLVLAAAAVGDTSTNLSPVAVYIAFWVGLTFACGAMGNVWNLLNPYDTAARELEREKSAVGPVGYTTAAVGIGAFVWLELVYPDRANPRVLFVALAGYTLLVLAGVWRWGRSWLAHGEGFTALFRVLGHNGIVGKGTDGLLRLRPPCSGLTTLKAEPGLVALVVVVLGSTTFDGLTRTRLWQDVSARYTGTASTIVGTIGLAWAIAGVAIIYTGATRLMGRLVDTDLEWRELSDAFAPSLVPIALAYSVAHYFSLLVLEGQSIIALISDPFGWGWNLLGTSDRAVNYLLLQPIVISWIQAGAIIVGHVAAVVVAHDRAIGLFGPTKATRSQYPLLVAMVVFTCAGLFLLLGG